MRRVDRLRLVEWAMAQAIPPNYKTVLVSMALECDSPYLQVPFSVRRCHRQHVIQVNTIRRAVKVLQDRSLISHRGRKYLEDGYRYVNIYQLETDERVEVGSTEHPTHRVNPAPHPEEGGVNPAPHFDESVTDRNKVIHNSSTGGVNPAPPNIYTNTTSLQNTNRGSQIDPTPQEVESTEHPTGNGSETALANLPPNVKPGLVRLIELYPTVEGEQSFSQADGEYRERRREGHTDSQMIEGIKRYAAFLQAKGSAPQFTMHLKKFLGPDKHFLKPWAVTTTHPAGGKPSKLERAAAAYSKAGYSQ